MFNKLAGKILFRWFHFTETITEPLPEKCIIALAPHTSNWDFIVGNLYSRAKGFHCDFLMKKEWFFWPMGILMRRLGGIPVYRSKQMHSTDIIAEQAKQAKTFRLCITPEGTRKQVKRFKRGFYEIATNANVPIAITYINYKTRHMGVGPLIMPSGDFDADMRIILDFYSNVAPRNDKGWNIELLKSTYREK